MRIVFRSQVMKYNVFIPIAIGTIKISNLIRKKKISVMLLVLGTTVLLSCGGDDAPVAVDEPTGHLITGQVSGAEGTDVILAVFEGGAEVNIDTAKIAGGKFELRTKTKELREYVLYFDKEMPIILFLDENSNDVKISGSVPGIGNSYSIEGSDYSSAIKDYLVFLEQFYEQENDLVTKIQSMNPADSNSIKPLMAGLDSISAIQRTYALEHIMKDTASPVSWMLLRELIPASGLLGFDSTDLRYFKMVANGMRARYPYSEYPAYIDADIESINAQYAAMNAPPPAAGGAAPEIIMNDRNGKPLALSSLRGKIVLVDFWASWCGPCRQENPNVVRMYEKYKDKGFTIYSVSLDENRDKWLAAIDADNLSWPNHVSDLKGWSSEAVAAYEVNGIPATFLLDKEGNIIAKNLRGGQLEQKLQELLD
jgi:thiol-disulfide isomerase/thioredoxin